MISVFNQSLIQREKVKEDALVQLFGQLLVLSKIIQQLEIKFYLFKKKKNLVNSTLTNSIFMFYTIICIFF